MRNIEMIVTDLDRTLLRTDKTISEYSISVFEHCRKNGIKIVFATARPIRTVTHFALAIKPDAVIYHNGAVIHHLDGSIEKISIPIEEVRKILSDITVLYPNARLSVEISDTLYANFDVSLFWNNTTAIQTDFSDLPDLPADKIIVGVSSLSEVEEIARLLPTHLYAEMAENKLALVMHRDATKLNAIRSVAERCGVDLSDVAAFGDDFNDIGMLRMCGNGVAVANAIDEAIAAADYICDTNDNDGVAKWIEKHVGRE